MIQNKWGNSVPTQVFRSDPPDPQHCVSSEFTNRLLLIDVEICDEIQLSGYSVWLPMHQLQRSRVRSQHPSAQWNLRGGIWSSAEYSTKKKFKKSPPKIFLKKRFVTHAHREAVPPGGRWEPHAECARLPTVCRVTGQASLLNEYISRNN